MKSEIDEYVIFKVKEQRIANNLSQAEMAQLMNVSVGFIGKAESSKYPTHYNLQHLNKLAAILKCSPKDFLPEKPVNPILS